MSDRNATGGTAETNTSGTWPNGEPKSVRDACDKQQGAKK